MEKRYSIIITRAVLYTDNINEANNLFDKLLNDNNKDVYTNIKLYDYNKDVSIREYDSIVDKC